MTKGNGADPRVEQRDLDSLRVLTPDQIQEIDRALDNLGPDGALRVYISGGCLRILPVAADSDPNQPDCPN